MRNKRSTLTCCYWTFQNIWSHQESGTFRCHGTCCLWTGLCTRLLRGARASRCRSSATQTHNAPLLSTSPLYTRIHGNTVTLLRPRYFINNCKRLHIDTKTLSSSHSPVYVVPVDEVCVPNPFLIGTPSGVWQHSPSDTYIHTHTHTLQLTIQQLLGELVLNWISLFYTEYLSPWLLFLNDQHLWEGRINNLDKDQLSVKGLSVFICLR